MSEAVREMTREELITERDKYRSEADRLCWERIELECRAKEMQFCINRLKNELEESKINKQELPTEPIKVAEMLIATTGTYTNLLGKEQEYRVYNKSELRQIAEHLLVYCNHAGVE